MSQSAKIVMAIIGICSLIACFIWFQPKHKEVDKSINYDSLIHYIDSLNGELDTLKGTRDSLISVIDTSKVKINNVKAWYEKKLIDVTNQPVADDVVFFTEYLSETGK